MCNRDAMFPELRAYTGPQLIFELSQSYNVLRKRNLKKKYIYIYV